MLHFFAIFEFTGFKLELGSYLPVLGICKTLYAKNTVVITAKLGHPQDTFNRLPGLVIKPALADSFNITQPSLYKPKQ